MTYDFKIQNYNLDKQKYSIISVTGDSNLYRHYNDFLTRYCKDDEIDILDFGIPKEVAANIRLGEATIHLHTRLLPLKKITFPEKVCEKHNQFAKDGCLEWGVINWVYHISPLQIEYVDIISSPAFAWRANKETMFRRKLDLLAEKKYHLRLPKPVKIECKR